MSKNLKVKMKVMKRESMQRAMDSREFKSKRMMKMRKSKELINQNH